MATAVDYYENPMFSLRKWECERKLFHFERIPSLLEKGLNLDEIREIMEGSEKNYPIQLPRDFFENADVGDCLRREHEGFVEYHKQYSEKWIMYRDLFDNMSVGYKLKGLARRAVNLFSE